MLVSASIFVTSGQTTTTETVTTTATLTTTVTGTGTGAVTSGPSSTTALSSCVSVAGQPGPFLLRVVSDSDQKPITGAQVIATSQSTTVSCSGLPLTTTQTTLSFTTNNTGWYSLPSQNINIYLGYSITVKYSGQSYNFTAGLRPVSVTCATLYIPSGRTNVTTAEFQSTCPSTT